MNRFDLYSNAQYTPMSMQEAIMPAMIQRERHDRIDEEYGKLESEAAQAAYIAEGASPGSAMRQH